MATRGHLGGLARATADAALVLDAAGRDYVIIETVGVGQDEVDIVRLADVSVVMLVPGTGDDVQALKAGIMEIADIFVVNKADREGADRMVSSIESMLSLQTLPPGAWRDAGAQDRSHPRRWRPGAAGDAGSIPRRGHPRGRRTAIGAGADSAARSCDGPLSPTSRRGGPRQRTRRARRSRATRALDPRAAAVQVLARLWPPRES